MTHSHSAINSFNEQLKSHTEDRESWDNIMPMKDWTLEEYQNLYSMITAGFLVNHPEYNGAFMLKTYLEEEEDDCDDCEGKCRADETDTCEHCGVELRNGCANNPSDHSIFDGCCDICRDKCRSDDEEEEDLLECVGCNKFVCGILNAYCDDCRDNDEEYDCGCPANTHNSVLLINEHLGEEVYVCPDHEHDFVVKQGFYNEHTGWGKKEHDAKKEDKYWCVDCGIDFDWISGKSYAGAGVNSYHCGLCDKPKWEAHNKKYGQKKKYTFKKTISPQ